MHFELLCVLALSTLAACTTTSNSSAGVERDLTPLQREVVEWYRIGSRAADTGIVSPPLNEREAAWRAWGMKQGEAAFRYQDIGLRDPEEILRHVILDTRVEEQQFVDACVRHGYELTEVMTYVKFERNGLKQQIATMTQEYIRSSASR